VQLPSDVGLVEVGLVDPATGQWYLINENGTANPFFFGNPGDLPFVGDWDCDGIETPGLYRQSDGFVYLRNTNTQGPANLEFFFGDPGDVPLAGDFNGDGCDTVSIYRPDQARVFIINELGQNQGGLGAADYDFFFGNIGDKPVVGDFDGDGTDTIGLHRESTGFVYYRNTNASGKADAQFFFGDPGDKIVAGDWNNNTTESFGIYRPFTTTFYLRNSNSSGKADITISYGDSDWLPVAGNFGQEPHPTLPPTNGQPSAPIRAAFFYPWFPSTWGHGSDFPFSNYLPLQGYYDTEDPAVIAQQLSEAQYAGVEAFISSWWGAGHGTDAALTTLMDETTKPGSNHPDMRWAIYYEPEGYSDPSSADILVDLQYLEKTHFNDPAYLRVDGKPVVFVWADSSDDADMADRWDAANAAFGNNAFVVLKLFSGYETVPDQPDSWHQYGPASAYSDHAPYSATVSPGFWLKGESVRLERDIDRFTADVQRMVATGAYWQLITTWNEWGEGTGVEPTSQFGSIYLDALAENPTP